MFVCISQQWLRLAIVEANQSQNPDPTVTPAALVRGTPLGYVLVVETGFCMLVLNADPLVKPDTFRMDFPCLDVMHAGLCCAATIASMLVGLTTNLKDLLPQLEVETLVTLVGGNIKDCCPGHLDEVSFLFSALTICEILTLLQVISDVLKVELSKTSLETAVQHKIVTAVLQFGDPTNPVHVVFNRRVVAYWLKAFKLENPFHSDPLLGGAIITQRIAKAAQLARNLFDKNVLVHRERYNRLIAQVAASMDSGGC